MKLSDIHINISIHYGDQLGAQWCLKTRGVMLYNAVSSYLSFCSD